MSQLRGKPRGEAHPTRKPPRAGARLDKTGAETRRLQARRRLNLNVDSPANPGKGGQDGEKFGDLPSGGRRRRPTDPDLLTVSQKFALRREKRCGGQVFPPARLKRPRGDDARLARRRAAQAARRHGSEKAAAETLFDPGD